jgi:hypothetical protein
MSTAADQAPAEPAPPVATIHEAERASGASGLVLYGREIELAAAVARRKAGQDVIVRGSDHKQNRRLAEWIEPPIGLAKRQQPHKYAGPMSLPHYQQKQAPPDGHTFDETERRKGRKKA